MSQERTSPTKSSQSPKKSPRSPKKSSSSGSPKKSSSGQIASQDSEPTTFEELFDCFCKFGDRSSEDIALRNIDKWFKQVDLFSDKMTTTDTAIAFSKIAKNKKKLTRDEFLEMLSQLAEEKGMTVEEFQSKLMTAGRPSLENITKPIRGSIAADNMERLTNTSSYTGTHRERFDAEGKGLGLAGRYDVSSSDGYVQGYKNKGNYGGQDEPGPDDQQ